MMMAPSGDMIMKSIMMVNWTSASNATTSDWYGEKPRSSAFCSSIGATRISSVMTFIRGGEMDAAVAGIKWGGFDLIPRLDSKTWLQHVGHAERAERGCSKAKSRRDIVRSKAKYRRFAASGFRSELFRHFPTLSPIARLRPRQAAVNS